MPKEGMTAETIDIKGHNGDTVQAYYARPMGAGPHSGVVVIHHMPGWDEWTREVVRKFAQHGYLAIAPHLYSRWGSGAPDDMAARARGAGGVGDDQMMGDVEAAAAYLRAQGDSNSKVGVIGFCSGGRQTYIAACLGNFDAAVDCWGGGVIPGPPGGGGGAGGAPPATPSVVRHAAIELSPQMNAPLLGLFGNDDRNPDPEQVNNTEAELKKLGKTYEFHRYDGAGHAFLAVDRPSYRQEAASDAWKQIFAWYEKYLGKPVAVSDSI